MEKSEENKAAKAIEELQNRIKGLENEIKKKRNEVIVTKEKLINYQIEKSESHQISLNEAIKAQKMLECSSQNLIELRQIRKENQILKLQIHQVQSEIISISQKPSHKKIEETEERKHNEKLLLEFENLLSLLLFPPNFELNVSLQNISNRTNFFTSVSDKTYSITASVHTVIQKIHNLPSPLSHQNFHKKQEIVIILLNSKFLYCKLLEEIWNLQKSKINSKFKTRVQDKIEQKQVYLYKLKRAIDKYQFNK